MRAKLISTEGDEGGLAVLLVNGVEIQAMDCLGYATSNAPVPLVGQEFEPKFTCLFSDNETWKDVFQGNPDQLKKLVTTGLWSYRAYGQIVTPGGNDEEVEVECGEISVPLPFEVHDPQCLGEFVAFDIERLSVWRE